MAHVGISKETKAKLLADAANGQGIELWLFQFIRSDPEFQGVLFRTAEDVQNWLFLEKLSEYRAEERRAALPPVTAPIQQRSPVVRKPIPPQRRLKSQRPPKQRPRQNQAQPKRPFLPPPSGPKVLLPGNDVMFVKSFEFTHCPKSLVSGSEAR